MANLSHYGSDALAEVHNHDNMNNNMLNQAMQAMPAYQANDLDAYDSDCDELNTAKISLAEVHNHDTMNNMINQAVQVMPSSEQSNVVNHSETKIISDSNIIPYSQSAIVIPNSEETLMLAEESRSKMLLKQKDPMMLEKKVNTTPVDYAVLNQLSQDFETRFVPQTELSAEQAFWSQNSVNSPEPTLSSRPTKVEVPKELPKVSMVNTSLKKLKHHLAGFDVVVKERTTATAITEGSWGPKCLSSNGTGCGTTLFRVKTFEVKMNQVLNENERLLEQVICKDIVNIIVNSSVNNAYENVHECEKCLKLETELQKDFIEKEIYDKLFKSYTTLEKHSQSQEKDTVIKKLKERIKSLSGNMNEDKVKKDIEEIETINIELDHRVSKLIAENEHLKQTYKQLYDSIKPSRIRSKEQCDDLINQVNLKSIEIYDLNASLQEKVLVITALKDDLRKLKGKALPDNVVMKHTIDPEMLKIDVEYLNPRLLNNRSAHSDYLKHTQEEATILREIVEQGKSQNPLNESLDSACKYTKQIQELLIIIKKTCPSFNNSSEKLVAVTPKNKDKRVRFIEPVTSSGNTITKSASTSNLVSNRPMLSSTGVKPPTSASGSQPSDNTKKDKILQTPSSTQKNKVEAHPRKVKSIGQFCDCDSNLEVAFRQHTCFIRNLEGVDLLTGSRGNNLYTLSLGDMMASSPICLLSKASKTKSWLWHRRLSHLNFGAINHLARHGLVRGLPKLKFEKDHLCSACAMGKSKKKPHKPKSEDTNQEKLYLLHMDLCGPMRVASVNGKKYILVIVDDYSRFTWVKCLRSKDEAPDFIIKFLKMIQKVGISHETSVARSPQQNGVVERRNRTLIEAARTMLIYAKAPRIIETIHVYFNELTAMASEHSSSGPALYEMTHATISLGLVLNPPPLTPFVPPSRTDWDILFQPLFDELLTPPPSVDLPAPEVVAPIDEVVAPEPASLTGSPSSTTVDQDAPSPSNSQTTPKTQSLIIPNDVEEDNLDLDAAHMNNDSYFGILIPEVPSDQSSSSGIIHTIVHPDHQVSEHNSKWIKDHPLENIISELDRLVSTRLQLHEQALFCYYDAFITVVEPMTYKDALT
ncbi:retrovirus-related pol polyprotein from transposon TNT 1-94 [Tanacetum coccineum]